MLKQQANPATNPQNPPANTPENEGDTRTFRLIVSSAAEAVSIIQNKLGKRASVQSVRQCHPTGVSRLWASPKLEIIVNLPPEHKPEEPFALPHQSTDPATPRNLTVSDQEALPDPEPQEETLASGSDPIPPSRASAFAPQSRDTDKSHPRLEVILRQSGFPSAIIDRMTNLPQWKAMNDRPIEHGLADFVALLKKEFLEQQNRGLTGFAAFIGTPGVGKSTALRKLVANQVFVHGRKVQILKIDDEEPNPDDILNVFCDIIGVPLVRDPSDLNLQEETQLYVDLPGLLPRESSRIFAFRRTLDELDIDTRVLVMNGLYDENSLNQAFNLGKRLGATHQTFTHLDELLQWEKLWKFVLKGSYPLMFTSMGGESDPYPNEDFLPLLIHKTFPQILTYP